jgi:hypothetical protein
MKKKQKEFAAMFRQMTGGKTSIQAPRIPQEHAGVSGIDAERMARGYQPSRIVSYRWRS